MFDVSFGELLLILIVGLLVFGPDKLPHAVRTASLWMARARRSFNQVRTDIEREVGLDELKRDIHNQTLLESLRDIKNDLTDTQRELDQLPYAVDQRVRENLQAEIDAAQAAIPADDKQKGLGQDTPRHDDRPQNDLEQNDPGHREAADAQAYDRQLADIERSVQPAPTPATAAADAPADTRATRT